MPQTDPPKPAYETFIDEAEQKMAALVKLITEQPNHADRITAIIVLSKMWETIEGTLRSAIATMDATYKVAAENRDLKMIAHIAKDNKMLAACAAYRSWSERYLGELLTSEERK